MQKASEEIKVISKAVEDAVESNAKLLEQKNALEVKQEEAIKSRQILEDVLSKTEASYQEAKKAESKLEEVAAQLSKERGRNEDLIRLNGTLQVYYTFGLGWRLIFLLG